MNYGYIIDCLAANRQTFEVLLAGWVREDYLWKPAPEKWCVLEVLCHLYDEERGDFRARTRQVLETPADALPAIDPVGWVKQRKYMEQDFDSVREKFLLEREESVRWLRSLEHPKWENAYVHPKFGPMTANMFLANWLAHDYLHFRQLTRIRFERLKLLSDEDLSYAGNW